MFRKTVKYWCYWFICLKTTALHIDMVNGLGTDARMMAVTRYMSARVKPHAIVSDREATAREFEVRQQ